MLILKIIIFIYFGAAILAGALFGLSMLISGERRYNFMCGAIEEAKDMYFGFYEDSNLVFLLAHLKAFFATLFIAITTAVGSLFSLSIFLKCKK